MELVSTFLENILVVENASTAQSKENHPVAIDASSPSTMRLDKGVAQPTPGTLSSYWYLENDPKKASNLLTDKLMEKVLSVMMETDLELTPRLQKRMKIHKTRPPLSMNLMTVNSQQMAQKTLPLFELFDDMELLFTWQNPYYTVGFALLATHMILWPYLMTAIPSFVLIKKFMVPSFLKLYPPDPSVVDGVFWELNPIPYDGPPLSKYEPPKPISIYSREYLMNFTDMQNQQVGYVRLYDLLVSWGQHYFLFADQDVSCVVFFILIGTIVWNLTFLPYLVPLILYNMPWKMCAICYLWAIILFNHPAVKNRILDSLATEEARVTRLDQTVKAENFLVRILASEDRLEHILRQVEVYELQRLGSGSIWEPIGFTSTFYATNHPLRILHDDDEAHSSDVSVVADDEHIFRKATLAEIKPPKFYDFVDEPWTIDLEASAWVNANFIMDLVSVDADEKWVYDFVGDESLPVYRRRRWVRNCKRTFVRPTKDETDTLSRSISQILA